MRPGLAVAALAAGLLSPSGAAAAAFEVHYLDAPGEGFFDVTPVAPPPGSQATTLGEARRAAFAYAVDVWAGQLASRAVVHIDARLEALACTATSASLGAAGSTTLHYDFPGAPVQGTWYVQAMANALASSARGAAVDLDPSTSDITAYFNADLDDPTCLGPTGWYYGTDGRPPRGSIDFASTVLHELAHGLGFITTIDPATGTLFGGRPDAFSRLLERHGATPADLASMTDAQRALALTSEPSLHFVGRETTTAAQASLSAGLAQGHPRMYGPATALAGSTGSHFSAALSPDDLLEPFYASPTQDTRLAAAALRDTGWPTSLGGLPVPSGERGYVVALAFALLALGSARGRRAPRERPAL